MKKSWKMVLGAVLAVSLAGVFTSCDLLNGAKKEETKTVYEISVDTESLKMVVGGDAKTVTVTTNGTAKVEVENEDVATAVLEGSTITVTPVAAGSTLVTVTCNEDTTKTAEILVTVEKNTMVLTLNIADEIAIPGGSITVKYGSGSDTVDESDDKYTTVDAVVAEDGKSASVELDKAYSNEWNWFNGIVLTVKNADGSDIDVTLEKDYLEFNQDGVSLAVTKTIENKIFTINFDGFEIPGGTVTGFIYTTTENDWATEGNATAADVTVAEDGKSATVTLEKSKVQSGGWFQANFADIVIKDKDGNAITPTSGNSNGWFDYNGDMTTTLKVDADVYTSLCSEKEITSEGSYSSVLEASAFENITITTLKITISTDVSGAWASVSAANSWATETYKSDCVNTTVYLTSTDNADFISALATNGLYIEASAGAYKVTVEYK